MLILSEWEQQIIIVMPNKKRSTNLPFTAILALNSNNPYESGSCVKIQIYTQKNFPIEKKNENETKHIKTWTTVCAKQCKKWKETDEIAEDFSEFHFRRKMESKRHHEKSHDKKHLQLKYHLQTRNWLADLSIQNENKSKMKSSKCANNCDERITMVSVYETLVQRLFLVLTRICSRKKN